MSVTVSAGWRDRVVADGLDRDVWRAARESCIGASDAKMLAKPSSVDKYLATKIRRSPWTGNDYTASGHRWEPMMLAWAGIPANLALIHAPLEIGFAATPDGLGDGVLAECKARHNKPATGPTLPEWRQIAWQFLCVVEADRLEFIEAPLRDGELFGEPESRVILRGDPKVREITDRIVPIATDLLARLRAALELQKEMGL